jgi:hypothetical protein
MASRPFSCSLRHRVGEIALALFMALAFPWGPSAIAAEAATGNPAANAATTPENPDAAAAGRAMAPSTAAAEHGRAVLNDTVRLEKSAPAPAVDSSSADGFHLFVKILFAGLCIGSFVATAWLVYLLGMFIRRGSDFGVETHWGGFGGGLGGWTISPALIALVSSVAFATLTVVLAHKFADFAVSTPASSPAAPGAAGTPAAK